MFKNGNEFKILKINRISNKPQSLKINSGLPTNMTFYTTNSSKIYTIVKFLLKNNFKHKSTEGYSWKVFKSKKVNNTLKGIKRYAIPQSGY